MYTGTTIFSQVMRHLPWHHFHRIVQHYGGDYKVKSFRCADHYPGHGLCTVDLSRELARYRSLPMGHEIQALPHGHSLHGLPQQSVQCQREARLAHLCRVCPSAYRRSAPPVHRRGPGSRPERDRLCLGLHDHRPVPLSLPLGALPPYQGAIKLHTLLNLHGAIPEFVLISDGKLHDVHALDHLIPGPGAYYIMDRGYLDFGRLYRLHSARSLFVTRAKANFKFRRRYSHPVDRTTGLICDQTVLLSTFYPAKAYPEPLRRIKFFDVTTDLRLVFLTNDFASPALTIARLYKLRWQIELFFKWIKQHLRIKAFYGTSPNAVKTQIWIALSTYLLIAIIRKRLYLELPLYTILQVLSVSLFEKTPILQAFQDMHYITQNSDIHKQLMLFD